MDQPGGLQALVRDGVVQPGEYVEGTAFFSFHTEGPATFQPTIGIRIGDQTILEPMPGMTPEIPIPGNSSVPQVPIAQFCSSTRFPIVDDVKRVGFLYPVAMSGFAVPMHFTGTLPYKRQEICVVKQSEVNSIENAVVGYRAQVVELPRSAFKEVLPDITDEHYDLFRKNGLLCVLSTLGEGTYIEYLEHKASDIIYGGHFIRTHWEQPEVLTKQNFHDVLHDAIMQACQHVDLPTPRRIHHATDESNKEFERWIGRGFIVTNPHPLPLFDLQTITDISAGIITEDDQRFDVMKDVIIDSINCSYNLSEDKKDVDGTHDFAVTPHTILQSTAARSVTNPVLVAVRNWLEKKS